MKTVALIAPLLLLLGCASEDGRADANIEVDQPACLLLCLLIKNVKGDD